MKKYNKIITHVDGVSKIKVNGSYNTDGEFVGSYKLKKMTYGFTIPHIIFDKWIPFANIDPNAIYYIDPNRIKIKYLSGLIMPLTLESSVWSDVSEVFICS